MATGVGPFERLRRIWSPGREIEELVAELDPRGELDSMLRDFLHRIIEQDGPKTLILQLGEQDVVNTGTLRWEIVHYQANENAPGRREVSLWVEH